MALFERLGDEDDDNPFPEDETYQDKKPKKYFEKYCSKKENFYEGNKYTKDAKEPYKNKTGKINKK